MRSRNCAPKNAVRSCCDTVHLPAGYDDQAYIFTKSMPAGENIKLCRIHSISQQEEKLKWKLRLFSRNTENKNPWQQGRTSIRGNPRMCALRDRTAQTPECLGCFPSLCSEQGAAPLAPLCGYPCTLGEQTQFCKPHLFPKSYIPIS